MQTRPTFLLLAAALLGGPGCTQPDAAYVEAELEPQDPLSAFSRLQSVARAALVSRPQGASDAVDAERVDAVLATWSARGTVLSLGGGMRVATGIDGAPVEAGEAFLAEYAALFGLTGTSEMELIGSDPTMDGSRTWVRWRQTHAGMPVFGAAIGVQVDAAGDVVWVAGHLSPHAALPTRAPAVVPADVAARVVPEARGTPTLGWWDPEIFTSTDGGPARAAWRVLGVDESGEEREYFVDAVTADVLVARSRVEHDTHIEAFWNDGSVGTSGATSTGPGVLQYDTQCHSSGPNTCPSGWCVGGVCQTPSWLGTSATLRDHTSAFESYMRLRLFRDSWDNGRCGFPGFPCTDAGLHRMRATSDWGAGCGARWFPYTEPNVPAQIAIRTGNLSLDVVGHEFTHGIAYGTYPYPFGPSLQAAGIAEGIPDVLGELAESFTLGSADWTHGSTATACPGARFSMADPPSSLVSCDGVSAVARPDHLASWRDECNIAHYGAGIIDKAGYLLGRPGSAGPAVHGGLSTTGLGEAAASFLWYRVLTEHLIGAMGFAEVRDAMHQECSWSFSGAEYTNCINAIDSVGLWSGDGGSDIFTDEGAFDVVTQPITGFPNRRWFFYRANGTNQLEARARDCEVSDASCTWSGAYNVDSATSGASATVFGGEAFACFRNPSGRIWCDRVSASGTFLFGPDPNTVNGAQGAPSIAVFNGVLYMAYRNNDGKIIVHRYNTAGYWEGGINTGIATPFAPVLASATEDPVPGADSALWLVYRHPSGSSVAYRRFNPATSTFGAELIAGPSGGLVDATVGGITAAVFRGHLHIAGRDTFCPPGGPCSTPVYYASCATPCASSSTWSRWSAQQVGPVTGTPFLDAGGAGEQRLFLWYVQTNSNGYLLFRHKRSR